MRHDSAELCGLFEAIDKSSITISICTLKIVPRFAFCIHIQTALIQSQYPGSLSYILQYAFVVCNNITKYRLWASVYTYFIIVYC